MDETVETTTMMTQPIIIDLGKQKSGNIKDLKMGEGKLWGEVLGVVDEVKDRLGDEANGKVLVPVVMIYQRKLKRPQMKRMNRLLFPLAR